MTATVHTRAPQVRIDLQELGFATDPYPTYAQIREAGAMVPAGPGTYAVGRHADVVALLRDPRLSHRFPDSYRSFAVGAGATCEVLQRSVSSQESPAHGVVRGWIDGALGGAASTAWWRWCQCRVDATVRALVCRGHFDAVDDLGTRLAVDIVAHLYGLSPGARDIVTDAVPVLGRALNALRLPPADQRIADEAVAVCREAFTAVLDTGTGHPRGVLRLLDGGAPHERAVTIDNAIYLAFTATEMITSALATCCALLLTHPSELARLRAQPALVEPAVAELLRFDAPAQGTARRVTAPMEYGGVRLRPGRTVLLLLGSANRDPRAFHDPDRLDIARRDNPHLSFGGGPYRCVGARLATRLCAMVLASLIRYTRSLESHGSPMRHPPTSFGRRLASVPMAALPA